jgi:hypothetical protein
MEMRKFFVFVPVTIGLIFVLTCCSEDSATTPVPDPEWAQELLDAGTEPVYDSVIIAHDFADYPFHPESNLDYFLEKIKFADTSTYLLLPNPFDPAAQDTIRTYYWGTSSIETVQNEQMDYALLHAAYLSNNLLHLRNNIRIGDHEADVFSTFDVPYDTSKTYKYLMLESPPDAGATNVLYLVFAADTLSEVIYLPYVD